MSFFKNLTLERVFIMLSVLGSLVGGFLGALLAMTLILGLLQPGRPEVQAAQEPGPTGGGVAGAD